MQLRGHRCQHDSVPITCCRYSGSDLAALCREAAMQPIRELGSSVAHVPASRVRPLAVSDFAAALESTKPSVSKQQLSAYVQWTKDFGSV
jgi:SpoVK/Ycf46/Vps4 family AAA+-type ATPase